MSKYKMPTIMYEECLKATVVATEKIYAGECVAPDGSHFDGSANNWCYPLGIALETGEIGDTISVATHGTCYAWVYESVVGENDWLGLFTTSVSVDGVKYLYIEPAIGECRVGKPFEQVVATPGSMKLIKIRLTGRMVSKPA